MKKKYSFLEFARSVVFLLLCAVGYSAHAIPGDADGNGAINDQDVIAIVRHILGKTSATGSPDCNSDGSVNIQDVVCTIKLAVNSFTLTVNSSGATGVAIGGTAGYTGTTNYIKTNIPTGTAITLVAPAISGTASFGSWSGCDSTSALNCTVSMTAAKTVTVTYTPPPTPGDVTPTPVSPTVASSVCTDTAFLYTGVAPLQVGVAANTVDCNRISIVRGKVLDNSGQPIVGAVISINNHPEFGQTASRTDGMFDMAVNGGGPLTVNYNKSGYLVAQRQVQTTWRDYVWAPDVVLLARDSNVTAITPGSANMQAARGSVVTDADGTRQATTIFPAGTTATMVMADGSSQPLAALNVRATEFTVGNKGPQAMPGDLPPTSGYTYAVELSVDEADAAGASSVNFSQPLPVYLENFLGFPVGSIVPAGYYDRTKGQWIASDNGRVIKVLSISGGVASVDTDGDDVADSGAALGMTAAELQKLATLYTAGATLWRVPVSHFTPWDINWPFGTPSGATPPSQPSSSSSSPSLGGSRGKPDCVQGSIIGCEDQTLGERLPVIGTPHALHYTSARAAGNKSGYSLKIPLTGATLPPELKRVELEILIAGQKIVRTYNVAPNLFHAFTWDGMDGYGRPLQGTQQATVRIGFVYPATYKQPQEFKNSFGAVSGTGVSISANRSRGEITLWQQNTESVGGWDGARLGLGGWSLSAQHAYNPVTRVLALGDGTSQSGDTLEHVITTVAGNGQGCGFGFLNSDRYCPRGDFPVPASNSIGNNAGVSDGIAGGVDGSVYLVNGIYPGIDRLRPDGMVERFAGNGQCNSNFNPEGMQAKEAPICPTNVTTGPDGSVYFLSNPSGFGDVIWRVLPSGTLERVIGNVNGNATCLASEACGDGGYARQAELASGSTYDIAVGADGSLYILTYWTAAPTIAGQGIGRIRRVGPDGVVNTIAGTPTYDNPGYVAALSQEVPAKEAQFWSARTIAVAPDGSLYVNSGYSSEVVRRIGPDGIVKTVAGGGSGVNGVDGVANQVKLREISALAISREGVVYIAENYRYEDNYSRIRALLQDKVLVTVAGKGGGGDGGDSGAAPAAQISSNTDLAVTPDGALFAQGTYRIRRISSQLPAIGAQFTLVAQDGSEIYSFDGLGRHLSTIDALTGAIRYQFGYDGSGYLVSVTDVDGRVTTIERSGATPTAIVAPGGQRTTLSADSNGLLSAIANPANETTNLTYGAGGLLATLTDPKGGVYRFTYDGTGRLVKDEDPAGGSTTLARTEAANGFTVTTTTALGRTTSHQVETLDGGVLRRTSTDPSGGSTIMLINPDGTRETTYPDGMVHTVTTAPDPRFGMLAPITASETVRTPAGLSHTVTRTRAAVLADASDVMSVQTITDTETVNGNTTTSVYDAASRTLTINTHAGRQEVIVLNAAGRTVSRKWDPALQADTFTYTEGRLMAQTRNGVSSTLAYDAKGRLTDVTDATGGTTSYGYDAADRLISVTLPSGRRYETSYDASGKPVRVVMPNGSIHEIARNAIGKELFYTLPGTGGTQSWSHNAERNWISTTFPSGRTFDNTFDSSGRSVGRTYADASISYTLLGSSGQLGTIRRQPTSGASQNITSEYDGELTTAMQWVGAANIRFEYAYGADMYPSAYTIVHNDVRNDLPINYNADKLVSAMGPLAFTRGGPGGAPSQVASGPLVASYGYDSAGRIVSLREMVNDMAVYDLQLTYDARGKTTRRVENMAGAVADYAYGYDADGQLVSATRNSAAFENHGYDANGNRTTGGATHDAQDRLTSAGTLFDADGFLIQRGADNFSWSVKGELLSATVGGQTATYAYDGIGRRMARTVAGATTQYFYGSLDHPFQLTASIEPDGTLSLFHYDEMGRLLVMDRGSTRYYVASDQVGTPKIVMDAAGSAVKRVEVDSFGSILSDSAPAFTLPVGFTGGLYDEFTGLVRLGLRDYSPEQGRWTAKDPALFSGQANQYIYAKNDPIGRVDRDGMRSFGASAALGLAFGLKISFEEGKGMSICVEGGWGLGVGAEYSEDAGLDEEGMYQVAEGAFGPFGGSVQYKEGEECPLNIKGSIGALGIDNQGNKSLAHSLPLKASFKRTRMGCSQIPMSM